MLRMRQHKKKGSIHHIDGFNGKMKHITDATLEKFLHDPQYYEVFNRWAVDNLCSENLLFYTAVENYKKMEESEEARVEAALIYHTYIKDNAQNQVNLDFESKKEVEDRLSEPTKNMFDGSQYTIHELIKYDLLTKFMDSDVYRLTVGLPTLTRLHIPRKNQRVSDMPKLCTESVQKLEVCLRDPIARDEFLTFTRKEYSSALPLFYLDVVTFQEQPTPELASTIYKKYLGEDSEEEVDTDPKIKKVIYQNIQSGHIQADMFDKLKVQVYSCMAQDNFFRFQKEMIRRMAVL